MAAASASKRTPLYSVHRLLGARMVDFGGWEMPVQYSGIMDEHHAVRRAVGLFDVSHMGEIEIRGPEAFQLTDFVSTNAVGRLKIGQAQYSGLLYEHGGFADDVLVHKVAEDHYFLCVNASNQEKDFEHIAGVNRWAATVEFASERYAQLAFQGPRALATLQKLTWVDLAAIRYYHFQDGEVAGTGPGTGKNFFLPNEANSPACMRRGTRFAQRQRNCRGEPHSDSMVARGCGCAGGEFSGSG